MNSDPEKRLEAQADAPVKASPVPFSQHLLDISIHAAHAAWIVALIASVAKDGAIMSYALFMPPLVLASCLEMWRWALLGRQLVETKGPYSHASAIQSVNQDFLLFSWYVVPTFPPFKLLERHSAGCLDAPVKRQRSQIFAKFWLKSEVTLPLLLLGIFFFLFPLDAAPRLWGLGKFFPITCLFWIVEFGLFSKLLSVFVFSTFVRIHKGF